MKRVNKKETMNYGKTKWLLVSFAKAPFEIIDGDRGKNYPKKKDFSQNGYCLFLNTKNVKSNGFNFDNREFITMKKDRTLRAGKLQRGDVVLTTRGTIGNTAYYSNSVSFNYIRINSGMLIFRPNESELCGEYLFHFFQSQYFKKKCDSIISGAAQPQLPIRSLNEAIIPLPKLKIQNRIVEILSTWDQAIEKLDKLISAKQKQFKWLLKKLITDQKNNPKWKKVTVGEVFKLGRGRVISKKEIQKNHGIFPVYSSQTSNNGELGKINTYDFEGDYITWTTDGANAGSVFYRTGKFNCTNVCGTAKPIESKKINYQFVSYFLKGKTKKYVSYVGNPKLMNNIFSSIPILFPNQKIQTQIVFILNTTQQAIKLMQQLSSKYQEQKKGLMQQLLTGKRRVKI